MSASPAKKKVVKPAAHPKYIDMVCTAITTLGGRKGASRAAIKAYIVKSFKVDAEKAGGHINKALKAGLLKNVLVAGAPAGKVGAGCFKVVPKPVVKKVVKKKPAAKKAVKKVKKPAAKKTPKKKKPAAKKPAAKKPAAKKPAAKKAAKKPAAKKPAKKPAAAAKKKAAPKKK